MYSNLKEHKMYIIINSRQICQLVAFGKVPFVAIFVFEKNDVKYFSRRYIVS